MIGHALFALVHIALLAFAAWWMLAFSALLHVIYGAIAGRAQASDRAAREAAERAAQEAAERVRCPYCQEHVRWNAVKCMHCGSPLTPGSPPAHLLPAGPAERPDFSRREQEVITLVVLAVIAAVLVYSCTT